jgi:hypothetical protein
MSFLTSQDSTCPACKLPNEAEVWSIINVKEDPELKDLLLGGEINMVECHSCREVYYVDHFLIYHDPDEELIAFVYPLKYKEQDIDWEAKTKTDFEQSQSSLEPADRISYTPLTLFGLDSLVEIVTKVEEASIQSEIVATLAAQNNFPVRNLKPGAARRQNLPKVLPVAPDEGLSARDAVIKGIERLLAINDRLFVYGQTREMISNNPEVNIEF